MTETMALYAPGWTMDDAASAVHVARMVGHAAEYLPAHPAVTAALMAEARVECAALSERGRVINGG